MVTDVIIHPRVLPFPRPTPNHVIPLPEWGTLFFFSFFLRASSVPPALPPLPPPGSPPSPPPAFHVVARFFADPQFQARRRRSARSSFWYPFFPAVLIGALCIDVGNTPDNHVQKSWLPLGCLAFPTTLIPNFFHVHCSLTIHE